MKYISPNRNNFFDTASREKLGWLTKIEVMNAEIGSQILSQNLPLGGLTFEDKNGQPQIEIQVGKDTWHHQTHNFLAPIKVYFRRHDENSGGTIEIKEASRIEMLICLTAPANASTQNGESEAEDKAGNAH